MTFPAPKIASGRFRFPRALVCFGVLACPVAMPAQEQPQRKLDAARAAMAAGVEAAQHGHLDEAFRDFTRAAALAPGVSATHAALGSVLLAEDRIDAALRELDLAHSLDPADLSVDLNLARAEVSAGRFESAIALFHAALAATPPPELSAEESVAYATALSARGDTAAAEAAVRAALAQNPASAPLNDTLGAILSQQGRFEQALPLFEQAVAADPSLALAQYHLGVALLTLDRPQEALGPLELAAAAPAPGPPTHRFDAELQLGRALSALHRDTEALAHLHRAAELNATQGGASPRSRFALALALQASGDSKSALPLFDSALSEAANSDPSLVDSSALIDDALAHVQTGDSRGALPLYTRALAMGPDSATLREDFGVAYLQQADLDHAIEQFRSGLAREPASAHLHYDLGLALKLKDDLAGAIPELERSAELDPELPDPPYTLGVIRMQQARFADAAAQLKRATALQPENGNAWALLGSVLKDAGDPAGATDALRHAVALQPDQPSLHVQLAALESQAGDKAAAEADRKIAADLTREAIGRQRASFALKSGRALLQENKLPEAILQLANAAQADPTLSEPHSLLAQIYERQGKPADAAVERERAAELERERALELERQRAAELDRQRTAAAPASAPASPVAHP